VCTSGLKSGAGVASAGDGWKQTAVAGMMVNGGTVRVAGILGMISSGTLTLTPTWNTWSSLLTNPKPTAYLDHLEQCLSTWLPAVEAPDNPDALDCHSLWVQLIVAGG